MKFTPLPLKGAFLIAIEPQTDERGFFARQFCLDTFAAHGLQTRWAQFNTSFSKICGTLRGLHFQRSATAEVKLVRCLRGAVWDVIVDLREGSPTFGRWHGERLDEVNRAMIYVPNGFAHGFQTLTDGVEMFYFHSASYCAANEGGLRFDDPVVAVNWPLPITMISARDSALPSFDSLERIRI